MTPLTDKAIIIVALILLFFALLILIKILIIGDLSDKRLQKAFGGIVVLVTALMSGNAWVIGVSIFIGGLIVASEDFMKFLAAIMRTRGDKVAETIQALMTKASIEEQQFSAENEALEAKAAEAISAENTTASTDMRAGDSEIARVKNGGLPYTEFLKRIEKGTLRYVFKYMEGFDILEEDVRVGNYVFDGFAVSKKGTPYFLEVKVFPNITDKSGRIIARQVVTRLRLWLPKIVSVFDSLHKDSQAKQKPVLLLNLVFNTAKDPLRIKDQIEDLNLKKILSQIDSRVTIKFQYLSLIDLMEKGAFASLVEHKDIPKPNSGV
jgi:hypothetical protein